MVPVGESTALIETVEENCFAGLVPFGSGGVIFPFGSGRYCLPDLTNHSGDSRDQSYECMGRFSS